MNLPALQGVIARRILANFRADPAVLSAVLPPPFRPKLHNGYAIVGICLIRLEAVKPLGVLSPIGLASESAAHRLAVLWDDENGQTQEGVFIPRRDTGSLINHLVGGRLFPGEHHLADFRISDTGTNIDFAMKSRDGQVEVKVIGTVAETLPETSCFATLADASAFFETGCLGYSVRCNSEGLDGLLLQTRTWDVQALAVSGVYSSYFEDTTRFPNGSIVFDHALLMRNIKHEWHAAPNLPI